jgi:hypothetical protein
MAAEQGLAGVVEALGFGHALHVLPGGVVAHAAPQKLQAVFRGSHQEHGVSVEARAVGTGALL